MSVYRHTVDRSSHREFLGEGRKDPYTQDQIKAGDEIVFCAGCKSAFLYSSWEAMGGRHCNQTETLAEFPDAPRLGNVKKLQKKNTILTVFCYLLVLAIAVLGYFIYQQRKRIKDFQSRNLDQGIQISSMEDTQDKVNQKIVDISNKIDLTLDDCYDESITPINLEEKVFSLEEKLDCFVTERQNLETEKNNYKNQRDAYKNERDTYKNQRDNYRNERDTYKNALNAYPYSLSSGSEVSYQGYLSTNNQETNPILYRLYIPQQSRFDIDLKDMEADGDFEIIDSQGNTIDNSRSTSSGSDRLRNFSLQSGIYSIKVWNHSSRKSTQFTLRIRRI